MELTVLGVASLVLLLFEDNIESYCSEADSQCCHVALMAPLTLHNEPRSAARMAPVCMLPNCRSTHCSLPAPSALQHPWLVTLWVGEEP